ncbi:ATP-binding cassette domain-containing protein [Micromonospora sp. RP3T]|uniref:ATP-binding cassette domain-containing protein n=1 Tax=Micromonospora sp. RP3T TaxID=2135446 RepID=UPI000D16D969|nr:ATP-binding cassette domain-containing protein [Micromonospora sp. RP3T]PTA42951.1 ABC transporter ATP-binding protein [Micromonospora sp. RP3T]
MSEAFVSASNITFKYGRTTALAGVSFSLRNGVTALLGPNGAGKTTLLQVLATAVPPDSGRLALLGTEIQTSGERQKVRERLGYLPQRTGLYGNFSVAAFLDYMALLKKIVDREQRRSEVETVLNFVGLDADRNRRIKALSGGMRQRVGLAVALLGDPQFLVLDEPTVALDPEQRLRFRELIANLGERRTVLLSTHQTEDVAHISTHVLAMNHGRIIFDGSPSDLVDLARGRVWQSQSRTDQTLASWRTGAGYYRNVGTPPPGADTVEPTLDDGYILLLDQRPRVGNPV